MFIFKELGKTRHSTDFFLEDSTPKAENLCLSRSMVGFPDHDHFLNHTISPRLTSTAPFAVEEL